MTSKLELWNLALSHIGDKAGLSSPEPPYGSRQAELCGQYYDIARRMALSKVKPYFSRQRIVLAEVTDSLGTVMPEQWEFAYSKPTGIISLVGVFDPNNINDEDAAGYEYEADSSGAPVIYTNVEAAIGRVIIDVENVDKFEPAFVVGLSWLLASFIAGPLIKGKDGMAVSQECAKTAWAYLGQASTDDANQRERRSIFRDGQHMPSWVNARGFGDTLIPEDARIVRDEE